MGPVAAGRARSPARRAGAARGHRLPRTPSRCLAAGSDGALCRHLRPRRGGPGRPDGVLERGRQADHSHVHLAGRATPAPAPSRGRRRRRSRGRDNRHDPGRDGDRSPRADHRNAGDGRTRHDHAPAGSRRFAASQTRGPRPGRRRAARPADRGRSYRPRLGIQVQVRHRPYPGAALGPRRCSRGPSAAPGYGRWRTWTWMPRRGR